MDAGFVIDSLPRTGSTTLARLLDCHPDIRCLVEPFHPRRYNGQYHKMAIQARSVRLPLNLIWHRWNGIKHVWVGSTGFPFPKNPELNDEIVLAASRVIFLERRNLLRRYVSNVISRQLDFWIGTQHEFRARLEQAQLRELDPEIARKEMMKDRAVMADRLTLIQSNNIPYMQVAYEDLFGEDTSLAQQCEIVSNILAFLGYRNGCNHSLISSWTPLLDRNMYQWASAEVYHLIPGIERLEREVGGSEFGSLI